MSDRQQERDQEERDEEIAELRRHGANEIEANKAASDDARMKKIIPPELAFRVHKSLTEDGKFKTKIKAKKSDWIHNLIYLDGKKFDFNGRRYLREIYDAKYRSKLLKTGRQVEKSTMLANEFITNSIVLPYNKSLYVSPSHDQTRQFSNAKLKPWIEDSPLISDYFQSSAVSKQVFEKSFTNGSIGFLRSAFLNADRTRGITAYDLYIDEFQDILTSNLGVIQETQSHAPDPMTIYSGTPKSTDNTIEIEWQNSSQCEWLVPCHRHAPVYYNFLDERCIGKNGVICRRCGHGINPAEGRWVAFNDKRDTMGFRISQLMVPWMHTPAKWHDILVKLERLSKQVFYNEVLGISYDSASKPVSRTDLLACCSTKWPFRAEPDSWTNRVPVFAGVDWGEGCDGTERNTKGKLKVASYTVLCLGTYIDPKHFHIFYYRRFKGKEAHPEYCVPEIIKTLQAFGVRCAGVDWGHGWGVNSRVEEALGLNRVIQFQHVGTMKERKKLDEIGFKYLLNRNETIAEFINMIKDGQMTWPEWFKVADFLVDIEHVFTEYSEYSRTMKYDHKPSEPDDAMHASIYCWEAAKNFFGYM